MKLVVQSLLALSLVACASSLTGLRGKLEAGGVDVTALFRQPSEAELAEVRADWASRNVSPVDVAEVHRSVLSDGRVFRVLSHRVGDSLHYGGVVTPPADAPAPADGYPIAVSLIGFGPPFEAVLNPEASQSADATPAVTVFPSFRGTALVLGEERWTSDGDLYDQCDGGSDDVLAFINAVVSVTPRADPERIVIVGGSRGGNVAMIVAARDPRVQRVVSLAGPDSYLIEAYLDHPNIQPLYVNGFLRALAEGTGTEAEARRALIACSPLYFVEDLPAVQLHHGDADLAVPIAVLERMRRAWEMAGRDPAALETYRYEGEGHGFEASGELVRRRIDPFLAPALVP